MASSLPVSSLQFRPMQESFHRKPKRERNKLRSLREALDSSVSSGDSILIEGFTHLINFAAAHELLRLGKKNLTGIRLTPDLVYDQLIEGGALRKMIFSWAGNPGVGSLHALRRRSEATSSERIELEEFSHFGMLARLQAGSQGLPFAVLKNYPGTDYPRVQPLIRSIRCPYTNEELQTVPALEPDVAIIHVQRADIQGNAQIWGLIGTQKEAAFASKRVVIIAEEIVDTSEIRRDPNRTLIPGILVDHVVHEPWGCHPSYVQGFHDRDNDFYVSWDDISRDPKTYQAYLEEFVYSVPDRKAYLKKLDSNRLAQLKAKSRMSVGVDYGY